MNTPISRLLALALSLSSGLHAAQNEAIVAPIAAATVTNFQTKAAIAKSFVLFSLALEAKEEQQNGILTQCARFAEAEGAPADFINQLQALSNSPSAEQILASIKYFSQELNNHQIDLNYLDLWRKSYHLPFEQMLTLLMGDLGSTLIATEALRPINKDTIAALPEALRTKQASAIKATVFMLYLFNKENKHITPMDKRVQCAEMATRLGAPAIIARLLIGEANAQLPPNLRYELRELLYQIYADYGISRLGLRLWAERYDLSSKQALQLIEQDKIPFHDVYNIIDTMPSEMSKEEASTIAQGWAKDIQHMTSILKSIQSSEHADEDLAELYSLMPSFERLINIYFREDMEFSEKLTVADMEQIKQAREAFIEELKVIYKEKENLSPELVTFLDLFK